MAVGRTGSGPWARAVLPDGQELDVLVVGRVRTGDGRWWYELEAVLASRTLLQDGRSVCEPAPVAFSLPAEAVAPIVGEDYTDIPTNGAISGRQWQVENLRRYPDQPSRRLHRRDCWQARTGHQRVTTDDARRLLIDPDVIACSICHPEHALRHRR